MSGRILGNNYLKGATVLSSNAQSSYPAANMVDGRTNRQAAFSVNESPRVVVFDMLSSFAVDAVGIAKHNLGSVGASLLVEVSADNSTYTTLIDEAITSDSVLYFEAAAAITGRYVRISVSGHDETAYISDITVGKYIDTTTGQPVGYIPPSRSWNDQIMSNITRGNELAGITIIPKPLEFKINIQKINSESGSIFPDINSVIRSGPFYFLWANSEEDNISASAVFCWAKSSFKVRYDSYTTLGAVIDCMGFTR